jgi:hypothetical protein
MRSVRAWRTTDGDTPKRLPPSGHKASGLVLANQWAVRMLAEPAAPERVIITEGEPDFLVWATRLTEPVIGVVSGSWTVDFAARMPFGSELVVRTDLDQAGEKYARQILDSVKGRCTVWRKAA